MPNTGHFKYQCADCGHVALLARWDFIKKTRKPHCQKCGGTFWLPASHNAVVDQDRVSTASHATRNATDRNSAHLEVLPDQYRFAYSGTKIVRIESKGTRAEGYCKKHKIVNEIGGVVPTELQLQNDAPQQRVVRKIPTLGKAKKRT